MLFSWVCLIYSFWNGSLLLGHGSRLAEKPGQFRQMESFRPNALVARSVSEKLRECILEAGATQESYVHSTSLLYKDVLSLMDLLDTDEEEGLPEKKFKWSPRSALGQDLLRSAGDEVDWEGIAETIDEESSKQDKWCSTKCHDTVEWMVTLLCGAQPTPLHTIKNKSIQDTAQELLSQSGLLAPADTARLFVVRWADPDSDTPIMTAHSWIILRLQDSDGNEAAMMVQSDAGKFSVGKWLQQDSNELPSHAREAHAKFGKGRLIPLDEYANALRKVVDEGFLGDFGLPGSHDSGILAWQVFQNFKTDLHVTHEVFQRAVVNSKNFNKLRAGGFFTQDDIEMMGF